MAIRWNENRWRFVTQARSGPIGLDLQKKARRMQTIARVITTTEKHVRTGRYRASIGAQVLNEGGGLTILFGSNVQYARLLEHGSPPHRIAARNARALWWDMPNDRGWMPQPDDGRPVRFVEHPGNEGYLILHRAVRRSMKGAILIPS